ncbi:MAG TPA: PTS sugar transporter subunit IIA [Verrucomicrobiae bacterium]|nr:PTS sugar transporter subunit IIA [Verrucomicrobiae bacterium]
MLVNQEDKWEKLKVLDFLSPTAISVELAATSKRAALDELVGLLAKDGKIKDAKATVEVLMEREKLGSTGIGQGIAIPHAKTDQAQDVVAAFGLSRRGVQFDALDGEPVYIFFLLIAPPTAAGLHLKALARISRLLKDKFFRQSLRDIKDPAEVLKTIREEDRY